METATGEAVHVNGDGGHASYWLVGLDDHDRHIIATVGEDDHEVLELAKRGPGPLLPVDETAARAAAGLPGGRARLTWRPSPASFTPLLPVWEIVGDQRQRWVDQTGKVWDTLPLARRA